ncbi:MAG: hypothetical protein ACI8Z0_002840, partial [Lentimonas sp.]
MSVTPQEIFTVAQVALLKHGAGENQAMHVAKAVARA